MYANTSHSLRSLSISQDRKQKRKPMARETSFNYHLQSPLLPISLSLEYPSTLPLIFTNISNLLSSPSPYHLNILPLYPLSSLASLISSSPQYLPTPPLLFPNISNLLFSASPYYLNIFPIYPLSPLTSSILSPRHLPIASISSHSSLYLY